MRSAKEAEQWSEDQVADVTLDGELVALLDEVFINAVTVARRLLRLLEERGWTGWTKLERIDPPSWPRTSQAATASVQLPMADPWPPTPNDEMLIAPPAETPASSWCPEPVDQFGAEVRSAPRTAAIERDGQTR